MSKLTQMAVAAVFDGFERPTVSNSAAAAYAVWYIKPLKERHRYTFPIPIAGPSSYDTFRYFPTSESSWTDLRQRGHLKFEC